VLQVGRSLVDGSALATEQQIKDGCGAPAIGTYDSCCVSAAASVAAAETVIAYITLDDRPVRFIISVNPEQSEATWWLV